LDTVPLRRKIPGSAFLLLAVIPASAHDVITTKVTFDREIVRLFNTHCISCHHEGGMAFSLTTYKDARPWAKAIGEEVLHRRMPPWGAVKGFGDFRNDQALTAEQLELIVDWEEGGAPEGEEKDIPAPAKASSSPETKPRPAKEIAKEITVSGDWKVRSAFWLDGLLPKNVPDGSSFQITAEMPDGSVEPLLWLLDYKAQFAHPFLLRRSLLLPAGTVIRGVPTGSGVALLPGRYKAPAAPKPPATTGGN
jgi:hypothetical protein